MLKSLYKVKDIILNNLVYLIVNFGYKARIFFNENYIWRLKLRRSFKIIKHALGSFTYEDGYEKELENKIAAVRFFIVGSNLLCVWVIIANVFIGWIK